MPDQMLTMECKCHPTPIRMYIRPNIIWHPTIKVICALFKECIRDRFVQQFLLGFALCVKITLLNQCVKPISWCPRRDSNSHTRKGGGF